MLGLEVFVICLLFGALTHGQTTECSSKCRETETQLAIMSAGCSDVSWNISHC